MAERVTDPLVQPACEHRGESGGHRTEPAERRGRRAVRRQPALRLPHPAARECGLDPHARTGLGGRPLRARVLAGTGRPAGPALARRRHPVVEHPQVVGDRLRVVPGARVGVPEVVQQPLGGRGVPVRSRQRDGVPGDELRLLGRGAEPQVRPGVHLSHLAHRVPDGEQRRDQRHGGRGGRIGRPLRAPGRDLVRPMLRDRAAEQRVVQPGGVTRGHLGHRTGPAAAEAVRGRELGREVLREQRREQADLVAVGTRHHLDEPLVVQRREQPGGDQAVDAVELHHARAGEGRERLDLLRAGVGQQGAGRVRELGRPEGARRGPPPVDLGERTRLPADEGQRPHQTGEAARLRRHPGHREGVDLAAQQLARQRVHLAEAQRDHGQPDPGLQPGHQSTDGGGGGPGRPPGQEHRDPGRDVRGGEHTRGDGVQVVHVVDHDHRPLVNLALQHRAGVAHQGGAARARRPGPRERRTERPVAQGAHTVHADDVPTLARQGLAHLVGDPRPPGPGPADQLHRHTAAQVVQRTLHLVHPGPPRPARHTRCAPRRTLPGTRSRSDAPARHAAVPGRGPVGARLRFRRPGTVPA